MARQNVNFVDQHIEKVAIGVCGLILLAALYLGFGGGRFTVNGTGPAELANQVGQEAEQTAQAVLRAQPKSETPPPSGPNTPNDPVKELEDWFGEGSQGLSKIAKVDERLVSVAPPSPRFLSTVEVSEDQRHDLAKLVPPGIPVVTTGRASFELPAELPNLSEYSPQLKSGLKSDRSWVSVGAQVDLMQQGINFDLAKYPGASYLAVARVHLQRLDENDPERGWQDVETFLPFKEPDRSGFINSGAINFEAVSKFRQAVEQNQNVIARTPIPPTSKHAMPRVPYLDEAPGKGDANSRARKWITEGKKAMDGRKNEPADLDAAYLLASAAAATQGAQAKTLNEAQQLLQEVSKKLAAKRPQIANNPSRLPERLMPIVAHDLNVLPGHTYQYRIRYEAYNIFAGNKGELKNIEDARKVTLLSDWSPPSRPVQVTSDIYYFLTKADAAKKQATVTVFKKNRGAWIKEDFKVQVGDSVGGKGRKPPTNKTDFSTGAVCIDLNFDAKLDGKKDVSMVVSDNSGGRLQERFLSRDKSDKLYRDLESNKLANR